MAFRIRLVLVVFPMLLGGCGGSAVPKIRGADLNGGRLPGVTPRTMSLDVKDERVPEPEDAAGSLAAVNDALRELFSARGLELVDDSPNVLVVTLAYVDEPPEEWSRENCIEVRSRLAMSQGAFSEAGGTACFEYRHLLFGISLGGDATKAYTTALNLMLEQHDKQLLQLQQP